MSRSSLCIRRSLLACAATLAVTMVAQAAPIINIALLARPTGQGAGSAAFSSTITNPTNGSTYDYEVVYTILGSGSSFPTNANVTIPIASYRVSAPSSAATGDGMVTQTFTLNQKTTDPSQVTFDYANAGNDAAYANYPAQQTSTVGPGGGLARPDSTTPSNNYTTGNGITNSTVWRPAYPSLPSAWGTSIAYNGSGTSGGTPVNRGNGDFDMGNSSTTNGGAFRTGGDYGIASANTPALNVPVGNGVFTFTSVAAGNTTSTVTPGWQGFAQSTIMGIIRYLDASSTQQILPLTASMQFNSLGNPVADPVYSVTPLTITTVGSGPSQPGQYTLSGTPATINIMKGDSTAITSTIKNVGTNGTNDNVAFSNLGWTAPTSPNTITNLGGTTSGTLNTPDNVGATATGTFNGKVYGTQTLTTSVSTTNGTNGAPVRNGSAGQISINVGVMTPANGGSTNPGLTTFGSPLTATLGSSASYAGYGTKSNGTGTNAITGGTSADILDGTTGGARTIRMAWRTRANDEVFGGGLTTPPGPNLGVRSDVVQLTGMATDGSQSTDPTVRIQADKFVLQMSVSDSAFGGNHAALIAAAQSGFLYLGWLDDTAATTSANGGLPLWKNAVSGNFNNATAQPWNKAGVYSDDANGGTQGYAAYLAGTTGVSHEAKTAGQSRIGDWGVEITATGANVWAVLDHNSIFAAVPEPSSIVMFGFGLLGMVTMVRRRRTTAIIA